LDIGERWILDNESNEQEPPHGTTTKKEKEKKKAFSAIFVRTALIRAVFT